MAKSGTHLCVSSLDTVTKVSDRITCERDDLLEVTVPSSPPSLGSITPGLVHDGNEHHGDSV